MGAISLAKKAQNSDTGETTGFLRGATHKIGQWRYSGEKRDLRLDLLRGFAAVAMIIDHIGGKDSLLYTISGGDRFFVSAAEGFVFISGLVMGIVYAAVLARQGLRSALKKCAKRAATLYALTVTLSLVFAIVAYLLDLPFAPQLTADNLPSFVSSILTLHRAFYLTDVLLLYTLLVAATLPLLVLLSRGYGWLVMAGSWALWAVWQISPDSVQIPWVVTDGSMFHFSAWQVLFVTGLVLGYHREGWRRTLARKPLLSRSLRWAQWAGLVVSGLLVAGSIVLFFWDQAHPGNRIVGAQIVGMFGKPDVRAGRLAVFAALFAFGYLLTTVAWTPVRRLFGWLLLPVGQDALTVYTLHLGVIALAIEVGPKILVAAPFLMLDGTLVQAAGILLVLGAIRLKPRGKALAAASLGRLKLQVRAGVRSTQMGRGMSRMLGSIALAASTRGVSLRGLAQAGTALVALSVGALVLFSAGPALALVLKAHPNMQNAAGQGALAVPSAAAFAVPTGGVSLASDGSTGYALLASGTAVAAPRPTLPPLPSYVEKKTFYSPTLNRTMPYYIYFPPSYNSNTTTRYPVLYMLHGISGTNDEWVAYGLLGRAHDTMAAGQISQFIIVLPQGDQGYWMDHANGGPAWGAYTVRDVVGEIDSHYRTLADRGHRAIGGLSMGGYGALELAIAHPEVFSAAGADSPSLHDKASAPDYFGDQAYFTAHDPAHLFETQPDVARTLKLWLDDGQDDGWLPVVSRFHDTLAAAGIPHEWHIYSGAHDGEYWSAHILDYLQFYNSAFGSAPQTGVPTTPSDDLVWHGCALLL